MFNVKDILAAVRVCVLGALLFAPLTSHALPANDNHVALCDVTTTPTLPGTHEEDHRLARGDGIVPLHDGCDCRAVFEGCKDLCAMSEDPGNCATGCAMAHAFCIMACSMGP